MNIPRGLVLIALILVAVPAVFLLVVERVEPMDIGVRQVRWGGSGIEQQDFDPGFHLGIGGYHRWFLLPRKTHKAENR